jgi:hypothetical protein
MVGAGGPEGSRLPALSISGRNSSVEIKAIIPLNNTVLLVLIMVVSSV